MASPSERAFVNSKAMRRASVTNNKEDMSLEKENTRLRREFRAQELQLKAAQKRFELRKGKHVYPEGKKKNLNESPKHNRNETSTDSKEAPPVRKSSVGSLPPIHEHGRSGKVAAERMQVQTSNLTMASIKSHNEHESRRASLFPPVRDLYSRGSARSLHATNTSLSSSSYSQLNSDSKSDLSRSRAMSLPVPSSTRRLGAAAMETQEQGALLELNQSTEDKFGTWPRQGPVDFSNVSLRARIQFLSTLTRFLRTQTEDGEEDLEDKISDEMQGVYEELEHCRYLRKPIVKKPKDTRSGADQTG